MAKSELENFVSVVEKFVNEALFIRFQISLPLKSILAYFPERFSKMLSVLKKNMIMGF